LKNQITIFWIIISVSFNLICQVEKNNSNIDLTNIYPKWYYVNTISVSQNDEIQFVNSINSWDISYSKTNPLLVYKENDGLLFNYYTIRDYKEICPEGFRIPLVSDFDQLSKSASFSFNKNSYNSTDFILQGNQSILRGSEESDGIYSYLDDKSKLRYWVLDDYSFIELGKAISFTRNANSFFPIFDENKPFFVSAIDKKSGLNLYCIEMFEHLFKNTELTYNKLVPIEYGKLKNTLTDLMTNSKTKNFNFTGSLRFDTNGKNVSDGFGALDNGNNQILYYSIKNAISNWSVYPYYNDTKVRSYQSIEITHQSSTRKLNEKRLFRRYSNNTRFDDYYLDKSFLEEVYKCDQGKRDFRYSTEIKTTKTTINNSITSQKEIQIINKFIGKGPIYSAYSLLPGLGIMQITKNSEKSRDVGYSGKKNFYLGTSISLGLIGGAAKLVSNYYYNEYKRQVFSGDIKNNFKIANVSQKIFLSCIYSYGAMFVWDFSSTFGIGIGNKVLQRKVNKKLRKLDTPLILK
jgi:hypothetical protein